MLILTRKPMEKIMLDTPQGLIEVQILSVKGRQVKLGVEAPEAIPVHREEVRKRILKEKPKCSLNLDEDGKLII